MMPAPCRALSASCFVACITLAGCLGRLSSTSAVTPPTMPPPQAAASQATIATAAQSRIAAPVSQTVTVAVQTPTGGPSSPNAASPSAASPSTAAASPSQAQTTSASPAGPAPSQPSFSRAPTPSPRPPSPATQTRAPTMTKRERSTFFSAVDAFGACARNGRHCKLECVSTKGTSSCTLSALPAHRRSLEDTPRVR